MANKIIIKRTSSTGVLPNTTNSGNTSYIGAGELAINLTDKKMVSSNGSTTFEIGANLVNLSVTNVAQIDTKLQVGDHAGSGGYDFGSLALIEGDGNQNGYLQVVIQNANTGEFSTSDFIAVADDGTDTAKYADFGINGSMYNAPEFTLSDPYDAYVYSSDGHLTLGSLAAKDIIFHSSGGNTENELARFTTAGELRIGNSTVNTSITDTQIIASNLEIRDTATINTNSITIGNSSVNTIISSTVLDLGGEVQANGSAGTAGHVLKSAGSGANAYWAAATGSGTPGGIDTQVQFNDGGSTFGGDAGLTYNKTTDALTIAGSALVGANVVANTSALLVGNSSVNAVLTQSSFDIDGTIAAGNTTLVGFINVSSTANVGGATNLRGDATVNGALTVANTAALGNTTVTGFINVSSTANVGGATNLRGTLAVNGAVTVPNTAALGNTTITGFANVSTTLQVAGAVVLGTTTITANGGVGSSGQVLTSGASGNVYWSTVVGGGTPGGSNTFVQFNDSSGFGGDAGLTYDKTTDALSVAGSVAVGANVLANTSTLKAGNTTVASALLTLGGQINANGGVGTATQVLTSSGAGNVYWTSVPGVTIGGANTQVLFNDSGVSNGSAGFTFDKSSNTIQVTSKLRVGSASGYDFGTLALIEQDGNSNTWVQTIIQNANTGNNASSEMIVVADSGNDSVNYASFGINGSNYDQAAYNIGGALDAFVYSSNSDISIGTAANNGAIVFHANGTTSTNEVGRFNTTGLIVSNTIQANAITIGANLSLNTSTYFVGNSTVNTTQTSSLIQVSNSTSTANVTAAGFRILDTIANTTGFFVGANVHANSSSVDVGNTIIASALLTLGGQLNANGGVGTAGQVLKSGATGNVYWDTASGGGTPGGANTYIQYNDSGAFNGSAGFTFDESTNNITVANTISTANLSVSGVFTLATDSIQVGNATVNTAITNTDFTKNGVSVVPFGQQTIWVPAVAMYPQTTTGAASGTVEAATNRQMLRSLDFDTTTQEFVQFAVQMPKSYDLGTIVAQFVWSHAATTTNFGVVWAIDAYAYSDNIGVDQTWGTEQLIADTGGTTNNIYLSGETPAVTIGGTPGAEEYIIFRIKRVPANGSDTMAIDARLHGVKIHYTTNAATDT